jgi:hypothetical protein
MNRRILICILLAALTVTGCTAADTPSTTPPTAAPTTAITAPPETVPPETAPSETPTPEPPATEPAEPEPTQTAAPVTEPSAGLAENPAFTAIAGPDCDDAILAVICSAPFAEDGPAPTETWNEGAYDQLRICPRWIGSEVSAWEIRRWQDEEGENERLEGPVYSYVCGENTCIAAALDRPEGAPAWAILVTAPDGATGSLVLAYNGRYGTLSREYLTADAAAFCEERLDAEAEYLCILETVVEEQALSALLRAAERMEKEPWVALRRFCSPLCDFGDAAAYTIFRGEMEGDTYYLETARMREGYDPCEGSIADRVAGQAQRYAEIGNAEGILGVDREAGEDLYFDLNGLTVYNPTLLAREVAVKVNGIEIGTYELTEGDFVTLLEICCGELPGDVPVQVEVRVTGSRGDPEAAILEVWPSVGGNVSGSR